MDSYSNTAIAFGNLKDALLHFEYVIPMNISGIATGLRLTTTESGPAVERFEEISMEGYREMNASFPEPRDIVKLFPPHLAADPQFEVARNIYEGMLFTYMIKVTESQETYEKYIQELTKVSKTKQPIGPKKDSPTIQELHMLFAIIARKFHLENIPVDSSHFFIGNPSNENITNCLSALQIRVVDTTKVTLPQIMEFRKDKDAMNKMRKFRLFAYQQFKGKDKAFIEDDIQQRLSDYYDTLDASGFDTTIKTLSFLFDSKILMGTFATTAASLLMGNGQLAAEAFSAGAILELGKLSLEYAKHKNELKTICRENPISYIADARKTLEKKN